MQAICVTPSRELEVRDIPAPAQAAPGHLIVAMQASAINHGDKTFLKMPAAAGPAAKASLHEVWGASGAGRVLAVGEGVSADYLGKQVAIYRSLARTPHTVGLWCQTTQVSAQSCVVLPDSVSAQDYCGSLVNVITAYAFIEEIVAAGHQGIIATAGNSATGHALAALARRRQLPLILLVRSAAAREHLLSLGVEHVIVTQGGFTAELARLAAELNTTAVFEGVGGDLFSQIAPSLPLNSTVYFYGFLQGAQPFALPSALFMMKNLTLRRFSNFESDTVKNPQQLSAALHALSGIIADDMFKTRIGRSFSYTEIEHAMAYEATPGPKAILLA